MLRPDFSFNSLHMKKKLNCMPESSVSKRAKLSLLHSSKACLPYMAEFRFFYYL